MSERDTYSEPAEAILQRLDATTVIVESTSVRTRWADKPAFQAILRDLTHQKAAETNLRLSANLIQHVSDAIIALDVDGRISSWNPAAAALYGWDADDAVGLPIDALLGGDSSSANVLALARGTRAELTHRRRDGSAVHVIVSIADIKDSAGAVSGSVLISADVSERRKAEQIRQQADARYSAAVAALDEGLLIIDVDDRVETANPAALLLLANPGLLGERFGSATELMDEDGRPLSAETIGLEETRRQGTARPAFTASLQRPDGSRTYLSVSIRALPTESGDGPFPVVMCLLDVTDRHAAAELLRFEARHDHATGLANRNLVLETISDLLRTPDMPVGVLFIDLDRFKMVNDSLGHDAGDAVLRTIARRLAYEAPAESTVGRLAGDEFIVVLPGATVDEAQALGARLLGRLAGDEFVLVVPDATVTEMQTLATALLGRLCEPVRIMRRDLVVTCSIGIVVTEPGAGQGVRGRTNVGATDVLRDADVAMYYAKQHGRNRLATFDERFRRRAVDRLALEEDLRHGLDAGELSPAYQPIVELEGMVTAAVEALARWTHPRRGPVPPTVFIPIAEETGLIAPLGRLMLTRATQQVADWRTSGGVPDLVMSVNLSPRQLADPHVADRVSELLTARNLPAAALTLEITESALMDDPELAAQTLTRLRNLGVGISVDDFGTGYSSLSYLRRFPVTSVKIDRTFVESLGETRDDDAMVAGIVNLAHTLGLKVVAEGVEKESQLKTLTDLGCDFAQGYLFSRPLPAQALTPLLLRSESS
jgi:PAS domain S-box-containing protein